MNNKKKKKFNRYTGLLIIMIMIFSLLINEMVTLQMIHGEEYSARANVEFIKNIDYSAPRGEILDADGRVLATSLKSYNLIYVDTTESRKVLYQTIDEVRALLKNSGEDINDKFSLKTDPFRFEFGSEDPDFIKKSELRWKKDRGINDYLFNTVLREETGKSKISELNEKETDRLDELILEFSPEETYFYLIEFYKLYDALSPSAEEKKLYDKMSGREIHEELLKKFDWQTIRAYLVIRDSIRMESYQGSKAVTLMSNMKEETAFTFLQQLSKLPGIDVETNPIRLYPYQATAAHVIGYLNPIPAGSQNSYMEKGYDISKDYIGVSGIESAYEDWLRGSKGVKTVEVDKNGRTISELFELGTYPGNNVQLTLDANLQYTAERVLSDLIYEYSQVNTVHRVVGYTQNSTNATRGAIVVMEADTGNILAMASNPSYDPNLFAVPGRLTSEMYKEFFTPDYKAYAEELIRKMNLRTTVNAKTGETRPAVPEDLFRFNADGTVSDFNDIYAKPLFNYATQGLIPSASTFKVITGLAALEEGVLTPNTLIRDDGAYTNDQVGNPITNDGGGAYGNINMAKALAKSSNVFFADVGYRLYKAKGLNAIAEWAWKLGMGYNPEEKPHSTTGLEINENISGNVYNHYSKVEITKRLFMFDVVAFLNAGKARNTGRSFAPIDIGVNRADEEKKALGKEKIKEAVRNAFDISIDDANNYVRQDYAEVVQSLRKAFEEYIAILPEEEANGLESSKFYAEQIAAKIVYDQTTEIISPRNVLNSSIGQGDNQTSLLQIANALATIVNGGTRYKTNLVQRITDTEGNVIQENEPVVLEETGIKESSVNALLNGLRASTLPGGGSYATLKDFPIATGGKTGTGTFKENQQELGRDAFGLYTAVAPIDDPEIVVAVVIYDVTRGAFVVPAALAVFEEYFEEKLKTEYPDYVRQYEYELPEPISSYEDKVEGDDTEADTAADEENETQP